jgi:hypothetical protein
VEKAIVCASEHNWLEFRQGQPHHMRGFNNENVFKHIVEAKLLSKEELEKYAAEVDARTDRPFIVDIRLAEWLRGEKKNGAAAVLFERGGQKAPEEMKLRRLHWKLDAATAYAENKEWDKARKLVDEAGGMEGRPSEQIRVRHVKELIERQQGAAEAKPAPPAEADKAAASRSRGRATFAAVARV